MEVNCDGCAGCCMNWQSLLEEREGQTESPDDAPTTAQPDHELDTRLEDDRFRDPLDDDTTFVPLARDEIRAFLEAGQAVALTPRFWAAGDADASVDIDGRSIAAVAGRPAFFVGLRKPPKPVAPFGREEPTWLPTCVYLDPTTLQCRLYDSDLFPAECGSYPAHTLALETETECERVEDAFGGDRLLDDDVADDLEGLLLGPQAIGEKLFCHPDPDALAGVIDRLAAGEATCEDRAECLAVAASSSAGTFARSEHHYEWARERALETMRDESETGSDPPAAETGSWVGPAIREWHRRRARAGETVSSPEIANVVEDARGAPETPGWDVVDGE